MNLDRQFAVILLNWRGADDTLECLASLFSADVTPVVIVVDNASGDGSVEKIVRWADGEIPTPVANPAHANAHYDKIERPIEHEVRSGANRSAPLNLPLTIIESGGNLGFAGGNNCGLRAALNTPEIELFWLLNNDTITEAATPDALRRAFKQHPEWGIAGGPLRLYHQPDRHQLVGGMKFNPRTGNARGLGANSPVKADFDYTEAQEEIDFISGASICVTRDFLEQVGLMEERFFLYFEEIDWATRAKDKFATGIVPKAIVYHKEGASAGSPSLSGQKEKATARSPVSEYHFIRSKLIFGRKHYPEYLPVYYAISIAVIFRRISRGHWPQAKAAARAVFGLNLES